MKSKLRKTYLQKRKELSQTEVKLGSLQISDIISENFNLEGKTVHCFLPIEKNNEIDNWLLIDRVLGDGKVVIPKVNLKKNTLSHFYFEIETVLEQSSYGIMEPVNAKECNPKDIDIVIVPLLVFDLKGNRVGYGGGFYDRFIAQLKPNAKLIGVSLFDPIEEINDLHEFDKKLNFCITPSDIYSF